jgi:hypothetical protein
VGGRQWNLRDGQNGPGTLNSWFLKGTGRLLRAGEVIINIFKRNAVKPFLLELELYTEQ